MVGIDPKHKYSQTNPHAGGRELAGVICDAVTGGHEGLAKLHRGIDRQRSVGTARAAFGILHQIKTNYVTKALHLFRLRRMLFHSCFVEG